MVFYRRLRLWLLGNRTLFYLIQFHYCIFQHLAVKPEHRTFLGIHIIEEDGSISFYVWRVMFLGISDAVFIFSAILKPISAHISCLGVPNIIYIDDNLNGGPTRELACSNNLVANQVFSQAGWIVSQEKKQGPLQRILFLGLEVCSVSLKFFIPEKKIVKLLAEIDSLLSSKKVKLRVFASFLGLLQSCNKALGPVVRLMTRVSYLFLMHNVDRHSWNFFVSISPEVISELQFWQKNIVELNGFQFHVDMTMIDIGQDVAADASNIGLFGFKFVSNDYDIVLRRMLTNEERKKSSTHREMLGVHEIYATDKADQFMNSIVRHSTDNKAVVEILDHGSRKPELHAMAVDIFLNCRKKNITLFVEWKPRTHPLLVHADWGSRLFDQSSYSLDLDSFYVVLDFFRINIEVDCMADLWNRKAKIYFSRFPDPYCTAVNFFAQRLNNSLVHYCFPPPSLYTATVLHMFKFGVRGLILVPVWKSAAFWNNVAPDGTHLPAWVEKFLVFRPSGFIVDPLVISYTFKCKPVTFDMLALAVNFDSIDEDSLFISVKSIPKCLKKGCNICS